MPTLLPPFLLPIFALIAVTPDPVAFHLGPIPVLWYGLCYAIGLAATYIVITREARRRGLDQRLVDNGIIIVAAAALIGGRLYHVIDQWALYKDDPLTIILPPYTGLGVYGGIITGTIAAYFVTRHYRVSFLRWADVIAPGLFVMQAIGRWGNFFNQELYGPPTNLPWGITIDCAHRVVPYLCPGTPADQGFHPLFLYESISGILGAITLLWIARRYGPRMRPGDLLLIFFTWYAVVRFALETLRTGNWTFFGIPTAMLISGSVVVISLALLAYRHGPWAKDAERWGEPPPPDEDDLGEDEDDELVDDDDVIDDDDVADEVELEDVDDVEVDTGDAAGPDEASDEDSPEDDVDDVIDEVVDGDPGPRSGG